MVMVGGGCFGSNGHEMVPNFFVLNVLGVFLVNETPDLLIKSKLIFVHRRVPVCFLDTVSRLEAEIVPTS